MLYNVHLSSVHRWPVRLNSHQAESLLHANSEHNTKIPKNTVWRHQNLLSGDFYFPMRPLLLVCWLVVLSGQQLRSPDGSCRRDLLFVPAFDKVTSLGQDGVARRNTSVDSFRNSGTAFSVSRTCTSGTKRIQ